MKSLLLTTFLTILIAGGNADPLQDLNALQTFFSTTFMRKETGYYNGDVRDGKYAAGFNPSWAFFRFHHVCLRGANDGIFVGIDGVTSNVNDKSQTLSMEEWNDLIGSRFNDPLTAYILESNPIISNTSMRPLYFRNSTLFTNCNRQHSFAFNPSQFLMKLGFMYEFASCLLNNLGRQRIFKNDIALPFRFIV